MSIFAQKNGKKVIPRSIYLKFLVFCCLIGISSIALQPIQTALGGAMSEIRGNIIGNIEEAAGFEIRYASIRPAFFGSFEIRNLRLYKDGRSFFSVSRANIRFSILKLIIKNKTAIHTVLIEKPVLRIDLRRDTDLLKQISSGKTQKEKEAEKVILQKIAQYLPKNVNYKIRDGSLLFINGDIVCQLDGMNIDIQGDKRGILLDSSFDAEIRYSGLSDRTIVFHSNIDIKAIGEKNIQEAKADIVLSSISCSEQKIVKGPVIFFRPVSTMERTSLTPLFTIRPVNIGMSYKDRVVYLEQMPGKQNINYSFLYDFVTAKVNARVTMDDFSLGTSISLSNKYHKANHLLDLKTSGIFSYIRNENGNVDCNVNYKGGDNTDSFRINIYGNNDNIFIHDLYINTSEKTVKAGLMKGTVTANGEIALNDLRPQGNVSFKNFSLTGMESLNADFELKSGQNEIIILGNNFTAGEVGIEELLINIYPSEKDIGINASLICRDESSFFVDGVITRSPVQLEAMLILDSFSLYSLSGIFRPFVNYFNIPAFAGGYLRKNKLDAEVFISSDFENIIYNAPNLVLKNEIVLSEMSVSGTDRQFNLNHGVIYLKDEVFLFSVNAMYNNPADYNFNINASFKDVSWNVEGQILDGTTLIIRDPNGFHAYGNASNNGGISGYIEGVDYPVPIDTNLVYLNFYIALRYSAFDFWSIDVSYFEARDVDLIEGDSAIKISGSADQDGASFREIVFNDKVGTIFGNADFAWDPDFSYLQFFVNMTDGIENGEFYNFEGNLNNKHVHITSTISNMHIKRFIKSGNEMIASAQADLTWDSINSFAADVNVTDFYTVVDDKEIKGAGNILLTNDELLLQDLIFEYSDIKAVLSLVKFNRKEGEAVFHSDIKGIALGKDVDIQADFNASFNKMDSWLNFNQVYNSFNASLVISNFKYGEIQSNNTEFVFSGKNGAISISGGIDEMLRLEMDAQGNFYLGLSSPLPIRGSIAGTLKDFYLDAHCNYFFIDMKTLWMAATESDSDVNINGGFITGKIDIRGSVFNPEFFGIGKGSSFNIQVPNFIAQDIRPVPFNVVAEGYEMTFGPAVTVCGFGGGKASGWLRFESWSPKYIGLDIDISKDTPIPYDMDVAGLNASGDASGKLSIETHTKENYIELKGDLLMNNAEIVLGISDMSTSLDVFQENENNTIIELKITTGATADFFWPNRTNPIIRANPEIGTVFEITVDTQAQHYTLDSDINIRSGELSYFGRNFNIRQGTLVLNENEREFNPHITARAEIRDRIDSGPVRIAMIIENQPLLSFEPVFEADPSLTMLEIYSFLGQNYNLQDVDNPEMAQWNMLASTASLVTQIFERSDVFSQIISLRQIERTARDFLNLDMLSIRTNFIQNAIVTGMATGQDNSAGSYDPVPGNETNRVGNYFDNTTVSIGKYIGQDMFIHGTLTMKYDENNPSMGGIKLEPDIGIEWRSPFVNIRWDFIPSNPQDWYVNDNSITLSWSKTF